MLAVAVVLAVAVLAVAGPVAGVGGQVAWMARVVTASVWGAGVGWIWRVAAV